VEGGRLRVSTIITASREDALYFLFGVLMLHRNYLAYNVIDHCTFRCKNCTTYSEYAKPKFSQISSYENDVKKISEVLRVNKFELYGGEPLLHPQLVDYILIAKKHNLSKTVSVVTNGQLLPKQSDEFYSVVDNIVVSFYSKSHVDYDPIFDMLFDKKEKYGFSLDIKEQTLFTKYHLLYKQDDEATKYAFKKCWAKDRFNEDGCHTLSEGYYYKCSKPISQERFLKDAKMEIEHDFLKEDGVYLHDDNLEERLSAYIGSNEPLKSCSYCTGFEPPKIVSTNPVPTLQQEWVEWEMLPKKKPQGYPR